MDPGIWAAPVKGLNDTGFWPEARRPGQGGNLGHGPLQGSGWDQLKIGSSSEWPTPESIGELEIDLPFELSCSRVITVTGAIAVATLVALFVAMPITSMP